VKRGLDEPRRGPARSRAVALQYRDLDRLPEVVASGSGRLALEIAAIAERHGIPVERDGELAEMLAALEAGEGVPPESFRLVAELISFLYHADEEWRRGHGFLDALLTR